VAGPMKGAIFFKISTYGWTETYYPIGATLAAAASSMQAINTARMAIAKSDVAVTIIRVTDLSSPRTSLLIAPTTPAGTYAPTPAPNTLDPDQAILQGFNSGDGITRSRHYLRGIPDDQVSGSPKITLALTATFSTALSALATAMQNNAQMVIRKPGPVFTTKAIGSVLSAPTLRIRRAGRPSFLPRGRRLLV
jgi:hypothetical protein